jgi:hypothetical protein
LDLLIIRTTRNYRQLKRYRHFHTLQVTVIHALAFLVFTSRILATDFQHISYTNLTVTAAPRKFSYHSLSSFLPLSSTAISILIVANCSHGIPDLGYLFSEPESESLYDWRFTANQFVLTTSPLRLTTRMFFSTEYLLS